MGLFDVILFDNDQLFQRLLAAIATQGEVVGADLDENSFGEAPFITHFSTAAQDQNSNGLWTGTLTVNVFADAAIAFDVAKRFYAGIWAWNEPGVGVITGVGGISELGDLSAFNRIGDPVYMNTKAIVQYTGTFGYAATTI
jgi:hypothetical protein